LQDVVKNQQVFGYCSESDFQQLIMFVVLFYFIYYIVAVRDSDVKFFF